MPARARLRMIVVAMLGSMVLLLPLITHAGIIWDLSLSLPTPAANRGIADPAELFATAHTVFLSNSPFVLREGNTLIVDLLRESYSLPGQMIDVDRIRVMTFDTDLDTSAPPLDGLLRAPGPSGDFWLQAVAKTLLKNLFSDEFDSGRASHQSSDALQTTGSGDPWMSISRDGFDVKAAIESAHQEIKRGTRIAPQSLVTIDDKFFAVHELPNDSTVIRAMIFVMVHWKTTLMVAAGVFLLVGFFKLLIKILIYYSQRRLKIKRRHRRHRGGASRIKPSLPPQTPRKALH